MKTKITAVGIILCVIAACNVSNSNKKEPFDPHSLDGVYRFVYHRDIPAPDSLCGYSGCFDQKWYRNYIRIDYPDMQACAGRGQVSLYNPFGKEDVKVALTKDNLYEMKEINGNRISKKNIAYKITTDSSHFRDGITYYLNVNEIKDGNEYYGPSFENDGDSDLDKEYQQCINNAPDTTDIFPSTQTYKVKPQ